MTDFGVLLGGDTTEETETEQESSTSKNEQEGIDVAIPIAVSIGVIVVIAGAIAATIYGIRNRRVFDKVMDSVIQTNSQASYQQSIMYDNNPVNVKA